MHEQHFRTRLALSNEAAFQAIQQTSVMIIGIGGVGSFAAEALARMGIGTLILVDKDVVSISNLNRQLHATYDSVGKIKVDVMKDRIALLSNTCHVVALHQFVTSETLGALIETYTPEYVLDASDTLSVKVDIVATCVQHDIRYVSVLGMANKWDPTQVEYTTLNKTYNDPVARFMRSELRKRRIPLHRVPVVFSGELPCKPDYDSFDELHSVVGTRKETHPPASNVFVPSVGGLVAANAIISKIRSLNSEIKT